MTSYYDISPILGPKTPSWPTDPPVVFDHYKQISEGSDSNVLKISMSSHAGSHVDAPSHFFAGGKSVDQLPLDTLIGEAVVIETEAERIDGDLLRTALEGRPTTRLLIKTKNSALWSNSQFVHDFVGLTADAAQYLVSNGAVLVGIDYLSIEAQHGKGSPVHHNLLEHEIIIVEGLDLTDVEPGRYELICLPLRLENVDGAPARVVLKK